MAGIDDLIRGAVADIKSQKTNNSNSGISNDTRGVNISRVKGNTNYLNGGNKEKVGLDRGNDLSNIRTNNKLCNTIEALGYLDMAETKRVAKVVHNSILQRDMGRARNKCQVRLSKVFSYFIKARNGNKRCISAFSSYYLVYQGTQLSLKDLLYLNYVGGGSNLGQILGVVDSICMGITSIDTLGIRLSDMYGNSVAIKHLVGV